MVTTANAVRHFSVQRRKGGVSLHDDRFPLGRGVLGVARYLIVSSPVFPTESQLALEPPLVAGVFGFCVVIDEIAAVGLKRPSLLNQRGINGAEQIMGGNLGLVVLCSHRFISRCLHSWRY